MLRVLVALMDHLKVKTWPQIVQIWKVCSQCLAIHWKMKYYNLQLYKLKLHFGNHTTKIQFVGGFFAMNDNLFVDFENLQML